MKRIALLMLLATASLQAQDPPQPENPTMRVFNLKYVSPTKMARLLGRSERQADDQLKVLILHASKQDLDQVEQLIKRFDVAPQNVEVTIYIMSALAQPSTSAVPAELEGVVKQLKGMFSYKGYQLIDTQVIRMRAGGGGDASGVVDNGSPIKTVSQAKFETASVSADGTGRVIRIDGLKVGLKIPVWTPVKAGAPKSDYQYLDTGIRTDVDVKEGQKVVVGKANMDGSDRASIVVLTAKVVD